MNLKDKQLVIRYWKEGAQQSLRITEEKLEFHRRVTKQLAQGELRRIHDFYLWLSRCNAKS